MEDDRRLLGVGAPGVDNLDERDFVVQTQVEAQRSVVSSLPRGVLERLRPLAVDHDVLVLVRVVAVDRRGHRPHVPFRPHHRERLTDVPVVPSPDHRHALSGERLHRNLKLDRDVDVARLVGLPSAHAFVVLDHLDRVLLRDGVRATHGLLELSLGRRERGRLGGLRHFARLDLGAKRGGLAGGHLELLRGGGVGERQLCGLRLEVRAKLARLVHHAAQLLLHVEVLLHGFAGGVVHHLAQRVHVLAHVRELLLRIRPGLLRGAHRRLHRLQPVGRDGNLRLELAANRLNLSHRLDVGFIRRRRSLRLRRLELCLGLLQLAFHREEVILRDRLPLLAVRSPLLELSLGRRRVGQFALVLGAEFIRFFHHRLRDSLRGRLGVHELGA